MGNYLLNWANKTKTGTKDSRLSFPCSDTLGYSFEISGVRILAGRFGVTNDILNEPSLSSSGECTQPWAGGALSCWLKWQHHMHSLSGTGHIVFQFDVSILVNTDCTKGFLCSQECILLHVWSSFIATFHTQHKALNWELLHPLALGNSRFHSLLLHTCFTAPKWIILRIEPVYPNPSKTWTAVDTNVI